MKNSVEKVTYGEFIKLLTNEERELFIILQSHGIIPQAAHELMSLNKILKKFYSNEVIYLGDIVNTLNDCQKESIDKLKIIRM